MEKYDGKITVKRQAELLNVNRTSLYYRPAEKENPDIERMHQIDKIYTQWPHYGYRRIRAVLNDMGYKVNKKRVCG